MAPRTALRVEERIGADRVFGLWTNLYTVRSREEPGLRRRDDLATLARWCGAIGGAFVGVNPLHAIPNRGLAITPYSPSSRLYRNVLYLDPEAVPEWRGVRRPRARVPRSCVRRCFARLRAADAIDHAAVLDAKLRRAARALRRASSLRVASGRDAPRARAFAAYVAREGAPLRDFATWEVLAAHFAERLDLPSPNGALARCLSAPRHAGRRGVPYRARRRDRVPRLAPVRARGAARARRGRRARRGPRDRALPGSRGRLVGATPPTPGWRPRCSRRPSASARRPMPTRPTDRTGASRRSIRTRSRADGYRFFGALLRASFASAGALRIDHAMGLLRLFWIPRGRPGSEGTYVAYPADGAARRARAREPARGRARDRRGSRHGRPRASGRCSATGACSRRRCCTSSATPACRGRRMRSRTRALASVDTHDLPPLAGFVAGARSAHPPRGRRRSPTTPRSTPRSPSARASTTRGCSGCARKGCSLADARARRAALGVACHAFLARTPAPLVGVSLDDLAGEREPVNVPGVPVEQHRSWSRRMRAAIETLVADEAARAVLCTLAARARPPRGSG